MLSKIPFISTLCAFAACILYMLYFGLDQVDQSVVGLFIICSLVFGGIEWLVRHRRAAKPPAPQPKQPG
jgi:hypothetical protein